MPEIIKELSQNISSAIRFTLPGLFAIGLANISNPSHICGIEIQYLFLIGIIIGPVTHAIHRNLLFLLVESWLFLTPWTAVSNFKENWYSIAQGWKGFALVRYNEKIATSKLTGYLGHRWSLAHSVCVIGELTILLTSISESNSLIYNNFSLTLCIGIIILFIGIINMLVLYRVEKHLFTKDFKINEE